MVKYGILATRTQNKAADGRGRGERCSNQISPESALEDALDALLQQNAQEAFSQGQMKALRAGQVRRCHLRPAGD